MRWKDVKLGGKFTIGFGLIIILLVVVAFWSIRGIQNIVGNAEEVIDGNQLRTNIEEKHVQHLQWHAGPVHHLSGCRRFPGRRLLCWAGWPPSPFPL